MIIAYIDGENTWLVRENKETSTKDYIGLLVNNEATCSIISNFPISEFYLKKEDGDIEKLSFDKAILFYNLIKSYKEEEIVISSK